VNAFRTIVVLTLREAARRKLHVISLLVAAGFFALSLLPLVAGASETMIDPRHMRMTLAVFVCSFLGIAMLRFCTALLSATLGAAAISGEAESGSLRLILSRPVGRVAFLLAKWVGINVIALADVAVWITLLWASLLVQTNESHTELLRAGAVLGLYALVYSSLSILFSTFCSPSLAGALTLLCGAAAWSEGILRAIARIPVIDMPALERTGRMLAYVVPMAHIDRWVDRVLGDLGPLGFAMRIRHGPQQLAAPSDLIYTGVYVLCALAIACAIFARRDA
jgi:ABC-type transport system involved in multi-copper enzyme maturation permease subunit